MPTLQATRRTPYAVRQHDDFEPQHGLPESLPAGEAVLWQGSPQWTLVWRHVFHGVKAAAYFGVLLAWQVGVAMADGAALAEALRGAARVAPLYATALGLLAVLAWLSARSAVYTLTGRRVVMRIGVVLTVSYNLPLRCIDAAHLHGLARGHGDIALELGPDTRIAWLHLWPHARPWQLRRPQPMLRCVPDAAAVAERLQQAWALANAGRSAAVAAMPMVTQAATATLAPATTHSEAATTARRVPSRLTKEPSDGHGRPVTAALATLALCLPAFLAAHLPGGVAGWPQG
jgi:hypothetical protein